MHGFRLPKDFLIGTANSGNYSHCPSWHGSWMVFRWSLMSLRSYLAYHESLTECGMLLHLYEEDKKIAKLTWTPILN